MATVVFESPLQEPLRADAPTGGTLADLCDAVQAPVPFSCRSANCGTCRIVVLDGGAELEIPEDEELDLLDIFGAPKNQRLACCARLRAGPGIVRVRPVTEDE